jgi:siroheme synthase-like protein
VNAGLPVMLRLGGRRVLVVGGGAVGERSTLALLDAGARVIVVSPAVTPRLRELATAGEVEWREGLFEPGDAAGADLAFACTPDREVNAAVAAAARRQRALVLAVDDPGESDFTRMAAVQRGPLTLAVSTGEPPAPALAAAIRDRLDELVEPGAGRLVEAFAARRAAGERPGPAEAERIADRIVRRPARGAA